MRKIKTKQDLEQLLLNYRISIDNFDVCVSKVFDLLLTNKTLEMYHYIDLIWIFEDHKVKNIEIIDSCWAKDIVDSIVLNLND